MKKEHIGFLVLGVIIGVAVYLVVTQGGLWGGYKYVCGDGTEFSLKPAEDRSSVDITPTKNAAVFPMKTLSRVAGEVGMTFVGGSVVLFGKGQDLQLITTSSSTVCKPVNTSEPLEWGA